MTLFRAGHNAWRIETAHRAAVLIDACKFFLAVREAMKQAKHSIFIAAWDLDSRTRLVGESGEPDDGWPATLREFLIRLVEERPSIDVYLLAWDYAVLYALEREQFPSLKLGWNTPPQVHFHLDNEFPLGASHHQKIVVVDDAVAFSGGLDLTIRRWDTCQHNIEEGHRVDPAGAPYPPFHDVQMVVDGNAAAALGELVRERWTRSTGDRPKAPAPAVATPWPASASPDLCNVRIAIARTVPAHTDQMEVREVEHLFKDMVGVATRSIYIENQYLTCTDLANALVKRLREVPDLQVVIVTPHTPDTWLESHTMRNGRIRFTQILNDAGVSDRIRFLFPEVRNGDQTTYTLVHSKVMIVDDRVLRVGSANLNNRSMGTDSECDLALEAESEDERVAIRQIRARLLADHCGVAPKTAASALSNSSLINAAESLSGRGHRLQPVQDGEPDHGELAEYVEALADPRRPLEDAYLTSLLGRHAQAGNTSLWIKLAALVFLFLALTIAWRFPPLSETANPAKLGPMLRSLADEPWAPLLVIGVYIVGGLVAFPVLILIGATAATFGPLAGLAYAAIGSLASAIVTYAVGLTLGRETLRKVIGPRLKRVQERIAKGGVLAIAAIRLVPIAPFSIVNLVAGASEIRLSAFVLGTILGMAPGILLMSALGHQIGRIISNPTPSDVVILVAVGLCWLAIAAGTQFAVTKLGKRT
jgi:phospholipase D1/2